MIYSFKHLEAAMEKSVKKRYVAGFMFCGDEVALVRKERPAWQKGLLNAIGGKVENGETPSEAMVREFLEETRVATGRDQWRHFCRENGVDYWTDFFALRTNERHRIPTENDSGEVQGWVRLDKLGEMTQVGNLRWLVPMALDWRRIEVSVSAVKDNITERATW